MLLRLALIQLSYFQYTESEETNRHGISLSI